jgi:hypothetical protein
MRSVLFTFFLLSSLISCSSHKRPAPLEDPETEEKIVDLQKILNHAEGEASPVGRKVLTTGRSMIEKRKIVRGSCWDYANALYNKAGYSPNERITPIKSKMSGPYADPETIQPGDWLYFINYSFKESDHSGIFVEWTDFERKRGVVLSYVGGRKKTPGNYRIYNLKNVYYIIRPK